MRCAALVVAVLGCSNVPSPEECARRHAAAVAAVDAYLAPFEAEDKRRFDEIQAPLPRMRELSDVSMKLYDVQKAITCYPVSAVTKKQPASSDLAELHERLLRAIDAGRLVPTKLAEGGGVLDPETVASTTRAADALAAAGEPWNAKMAGQPTKPGGPWPAKQRAYLTSLETAWCDLENLVGPMINARSAALLAEMNELKSSIRAHPRDPSSSHRTDLALDVSHQLARDSGQPVTVAAELASDPGFAKVMPAIEASNRCGK